MNKPDKYLDQVVGTFFFCYQVTLSSFEVTLLCLYFRHYWLIFKDPNESPHRVSTPGEKFKYSSCHLYSFTLIISYYQICNLLHQHNLLYSLNQPLPFNHFKFGNFCDLKTLCWCYDKRKWIPTLHYTWITKPLAECFPK